MIVMRKRRTLKHSPDQVRRWPRRVIHCLANCPECGFMNDNYRKAARAATKHVRETGHKVSVDVGLVYYVGLR